MLTNSLLIFGFLASLFILWYRVSKKIPELIAIPDQVITERLEEDSAQLRLFLLHLKTYYKEKHYKESFWGFLEKSLCRLHIILLRWDNNVVALLKNVREKEGRKDEAVNGDYAEQVKEDTKVTLPKDNRIHEVRIKK